MLTFYNFRVKQGIRPHSMVIAASPKKHKFKDPLDLGDLQELMQKKYADNSEKKVRWAVKQYTLWRQQTIEEMPSGSTDEHFRHADLGDLRTIDKKSFAFVMCKFVTDVLKVNGEEYPPNTLKELVYCVQMFLHSRRKFWFLLDRSEDMFLDLFYVLDNGMKRRTLKVLAL